jgi:5-methyltetrahydropteroyltriglutamate--homocysteine methyltransferase
VTETSTLRPLATVYGYPRQGRDRELKTATEGYWAGRLTADELLAAAADLRRERWAEMAAAGLDELPSNDFSLYDHMLDTCVLLGAIPARHRNLSIDLSTPQGSLDRYFALARGSADVAPMEMTKWFDTNYHYLVPELGPDEAFVVDASKPLSEFRQAQAAGYLTRPVIIGPITFLLLAKSTAAGFEPLALADRLAAVYVELLGDLADAGVQWVQIDEPCLVTEPTQAVLSTFERVYDRLLRNSHRPKVLLASYFDRLGDSLPLLAQLPFEGLAMDFTGRAAANLTALASSPGVRDKRLVAGVIDGRNIWRADLEGALGTLGTLLGIAGRVDVAASCSLLHVPIDVTLERNLDPQVIGWFAFAVQKIEELRTLAAGLAAGVPAIPGELEVNRQRRAARASSAIVHRPEVRERVVTVTESDVQRTSQYAERSKLQRKRLGLPVLPTTTIGSFPQTDELRAARAALRSGRHDPSTYEETMRAEVRRVVDLQHDLGIDVVVHGEPERNDMVQYFAEQLDGFVATSHGWVQSYGSRYVRPPIIAGDVQRSQPMTVSWSTYAQSLTDRPVKGMLTGPVTMLAWSFVRDDQPLADTARQVALALRDEVTDLEAGGLGIIQVDEPALRETLPLRREDRAEYLSWAVESFKLATSAVADDTQIHTHMCYAEFGDVLDAIIEMDADVISLEAARSGMAIVSDLAAADYPNEVGPGVWDIHSPRIPSVEEIRERLLAMVGAISAERLWVNPDCGLKTRGYAETVDSLRNLVAAAREARAALPVGNAPG